MSTSLLLTNMAISVTVPLAVRLALYCKRTGLRRACLRVKLRIWHYK